MHPAIVSLETIVHSHIAERNYAKKLTYLKTIKPKSASSSSKRGTACMVLGVSLVMSTSVNPGLGIIRLPIRVSKTQGDFLCL